MLEFPLLHLLLNIPAAAAVIHGSDSICCFDSWAVQIPRTGLGFLRGRAGFVGGLGCRVFKFNIFILQHISSQKLWDTISSHFLFC